MITPIYQLHDVVIMLSLHKMFDLEGVSGVCLF